MTVTCALGFLQMYYPLGMALENDCSKAVVQTKPKEFWKNMFVVGSMRFLTVLLGNQKVDMGRFCNFIFIEYLPMIKCRTMSVASCWVKTQSEKTRIWTFRPTQRVLE